MSMFLYQTHTHKIKYVSTNITMNKTASYEETDSKLFSHVTVCTKLHGIGDPLKLQNRDAQTSHCNNISLFEMKLVYLK